MTNSGNKMVMIYEIKITNTRKLMENITSSPVKAIAIVFDKFRYKLAHNINYCIQVKMQSSSEANLFFG